MVFSAPKPVVLTLLHKVGPTGALRKTVVTTTTRW
jgi:hypothetical protein